MRLQEYINENEGKIIETLQKECKPFLREIRNCTSRYLIRGKKTEISTFRKIKRRKDRKPMSMAPKYMEFLDNVFEKVFGWRPRTTGVFAEFSKTIKSGYGEPYFIFPIGKFRYIYSNDVEDLFLDDFIKAPVTWHPWKNEIVFNDKIVSRMYSSQELEDMSKEEVMEDWIKNAFKNKNLCKAKNGYEIMFDCDQYYLVNPKYYETLQQELW